MSRPTATIETGIIVPYRSTTTSHGKLISLTETLRKAEVGQSFLIDQPRVKLCHNTAKRLGFRIRTHRTTDGKLRVTRTE